MKVKDMNCTFAIALIAITGIAIAIVNYRLRIPRDSHLIMYSSNGASMTLSHDSISFSAAPHHYTTNGLSHVAEYLPRLLSQSTRSRSLDIYSSDGNRGFSLTMNNATLEAMLSVEWRENPAQEKAIRAFFDSLGAAPTQDYLADNGGVTKATRCFTYPIKGDIDEIMSISHHILTNLCTISPNEGLNIRYQED